MPSETKTRETTKHVLFALSAGYCQYRGCDKRNTGDPLTGRVFNTGWVAHVIGSKPGGPRGDDELSEMLRDDIENLMLLCDVHHRVIDKEDPDGHPPEVLREMKQEHESRVELACGIPPDRKSHVLLYGANIGDHKTTLDYATTAPALLQRRRYPAKERFVIQAKDNHRRDKDPEYWPEERAHLAGKFEARVLPELANGADPHVSVFALAPQPLLVLLGSLLSDKKNVHVYQRHREPEPSWMWPDPDDADEPLAPEFVARPSSFDKPPALLLALSATVTADRVAEAMTGEHALWHVSIPRPNTHCIRTPRDLVVWRKFIAGALDEIKACHGQGSALHVFPVVPNSAAVCLGLVRQQKADLPLHMYDQIQGQGFVPAFTIE
jgi:SMODS-associated and fused to various effectors sensor domain